MKTMKQMLAGFLVAAMLVTGFVITPMDANAAEVETDDTGAEYYLDTENYNFTDFWDKDPEKRIAPTMSMATGTKVFGGWYRKNAETEKMEPITQTEAEGITNGAGIYAKFVPAEVLSVRAQLEAATEAADGENVGAADDATITKKTTYLRILSGVNGLDYQKVGFDIWYNKKYQETNKDATNITKVYKTITNSETDDAATTDKVESIAASQVFGSAATHFSVLRLADIYKENFEYVIYVTPQWTTLDGTLVEGQAKYVRVIDGYVSHHYISVPVDFVEGVEVAAGQMELYYPANELEFVGFDSGVLMSEMAHQVEEDGINGTVKIVGNIAEAPSNGAKGVDAESDIYANVWFKIKDTVLEEDCSDFYVFEMDGFEFCDWTEADADVTPWKVQYLRYK